MPWKYVSACEVGRAGEVMTVNFILSMTFVNGKANNTRQNVVMRFDSTNLSICHFNHSGYTCEGSINLFASETSRRFWKPLTLLFSGYRGAFVVGKRQGCDGGHWLPSGAQVKNEWSCTSTPATVLHDWTTKPIPPLSSCRLKILWFLQRWLRWGLLGTIFKGKAASLLHRLSRNVCKQLSIYAA